MMCLYEQSFTILLSVISRQCMSITNKKKIVLAHLQTFKPLALSNRELYVHEKLIFENQMCA